LPSISKPIFVSYQATLLISIRQLDDIATYFRANQWTFFATESSNRLQIILSA